MSNSFNISVKPEIAAAVVKIDANKTVIDENKVILVDVQGTKITSILTAVGLNKTELDGIRGADLTSILTNIGVNTTAIGVCAGILDAIKLKTDLLPQTFRGSFNHIGAWTNSAAYVDLINLSDNSGIIHFIALENFADTNITFRLTIDGVVSNELLHDTFDSVKFIVPQSSPDTDFIIQLSDTPFIIPLEFSTSLRLEFKRTAGTATPACNLTYNLD